MKGVYALTKDGRITVCVAPPDKRGTGRCNHVLHQDAGQSREDFICMANNFFAKKNKQLQNGAQYNPAINQKHNWVTAEDVSWSLDNSGTALVCNATGSGKSSIFSAVMDRYADKPCLFLSPGSEINDQMFSHNENEKVNKLGNLNIYTYQMLCKQWRDGTLDTFLDENVGSELGLVCLDEVHHLSANDEDGRAWQDTVNAIFSHYSDKPPKVFGATATLSGTDDGYTILNNKFNQKVLGNLTVEKAMDNGILQCPNVYTAPSARQLKDMNKLFERMKKKALGKPDKTGKIGAYRHYSKFDDVQKKVDDMYARMDAHEKNIDSALREHIGKLEAERPDRGVKVVVFCSSIKDTGSGGPGDDEIERLKKLLPNHTFECDSYHSKSKAESKNFFKRFCGKGEPVKPGHIMVLKTYDCFNEGVHPSDLSVSIKLRSTDSSTLFDQQNGRVYDMDAKEPSLIIDRSGDFCKRSFHDYEAMCKNANTVFNDCGFNDTWRAMNEGYAAAQFNETVSKDAGKPMKVTSHYMYTVKRPREDGRVLVEQRFVAREELRAQLGERGLEEVERELHRVPRAQLADGGLELRRVAERLGELLEERRRS